MQEASSTPVYKKVRPWHDALIVGFSAFAVMATSATSMYIFVSRGNKAEVQRNLLQVTRAAANLTDVDLHQTITAPEQKDSPEYQRVQKPYHALLAGHRDLRYIYTLVEKEGKAYFIIDTQQSSDQQQIAEQERKSTAGVMEEYAEIPPLMRRALTEQREIVEDEPYSDEWGTFFSAYVPLFDANQQFVGIVGADIDGTDFIRRMNNLLIPYVAGMLVSVILAVILAVIVLRVRRAYAVRSGVRQQQLQLFKEFQNHLLECTRTITDISLKIDGRTAQISGMAQSSTEKTVEATRSIQGSSDKIQGIADAALRLLAVVGELDRTMDHYAESLKDRMLKLSQSSQHSQEISVAMRDISGVIGIINDITERIDLLSLNASIEAARAGESGKGFAVVAGEIKVLASQARDSTDTISKRIHAMSEIVMRAVGANQETTTICEQVDRITLQTKQVISDQQHIVRDITEDISDVTRRADEIIAMVNNIAEMASDTSQKTLLMHKEMHLLYQQNNTLSDEIEAFVKQL